MSQTFTSNSCRLCLWKGSRLYNIFSKKYLKDKIMMLIPVTVGEGDGLSPFVCDDCLYKVELFLKFRETATRSDHIQREYKNFECSVGSETFNREVPPVLTKCAQSPTKSETKERNNKQDGRDFSGWPLEVAHEEETTSMEPTSSGALEEEISMSSKEQQSEDGKRSCDYCCQEFSNKEELHQHERKHINLECLVCDKKFETMEGLRIHVSKECSVPPSSAMSMDSPKKGNFRCGTCLRGFRSHIGLWRHRICTSHSVNSLPGRLRPRLQVARPKVVHRTVPYVGRGSRGGGGRGRGRGRGRGSRGGVHHKLGITRKWIYVQTPCDVCGRMFNSSHGMLIHRKHIHG